MFIHFTFGTLGKSGNNSEQTEKVIDLILKTKRLQASKCREFIPAYPVEGAKLIPPEMFKATDDGAAATFHPKQDPDWMKKLPDDTTITYLPVDVPMICFIKTPFSKLRTSAHPKEYGKFGLVLTDSFLKAKGIKPVYYYTEKSLWSDPLIVRWNYYARNHLHPEINKILENEIVSFRKPATLFPAFIKQVRIKITRTAGETAVEYLNKYARYPEGYDFTQEDEYRIVFPKGEDSLKFDESDLYLIIVPESAIRGKIESFLEENWSYQPRVEVFPS